MRAYLAFLSPLNQVRSQRHLYNLPNLQDVHGLINLTSVNHIFYLNDNPSLTDISGLSNLERIVSSSYHLQIDDPAQYTVKPLVGSTFCNAVVSGDVRVKYNGTLVTESQICDVN